LKLMYLIAMHISERNSNGAQNGPDLARYVFISTRLHNAN
jgi:hypothetical protein